MEIDVFVLMIFFINRQDIPYYFMTEVFQRVSFFYTYFNSVQILKVNLILSVFLLSVVVSE